MDSVRSLELDEYSALPASTEASAPLLPLDDKARAYIDAGSLVIFSSSFTGQQKNDVLYSSLLAQLAANKRYERFKEAKNWYKFYTDVMGHVGWFTQGFEFEKCESSQTDFTISQVTLQLLSGLIGGETDMMTAVKKTFDSLAKSSDALALFETNSASSKHGNLHGNFQVLLCNVNKNNQISVNVLAFYFHASELKENYFFADHKAEDITIFTSTEILTLDEEVYAQVREEVKNKLGIIISRKPGNVN